MWGENPPPLGGGFFDFLSLFNKIKKMKRKFLFLFFFLFLLPSLASADSYLEKRTFFVESSYDDFKREKLTATDFFVSQHAYFYLEDDWWNELSSKEKQKAIDGIKNLANEFDSKIYPFLTSLYGSENKPGIDKDERVTILLHRMREEAGGYFREGDNYEKRLFPSSNEREMVYLNLLYLDQPQIKPNLAHEFTHLIIFNQKNLILGVEEETWLIEMIADLSPTLLGYQDHLQRRIERFRQNPRDPLLEWKNEPPDYGSISVFGHYLLDQFGSQVFVNILHSKEKGISAIEKATGKKFEEIFRNWLLANYLNDCRFGREYCYQQEGLKNFRVLPEIEFLPISGESLFSLSRQIKDFSGYWQRFYGGKGNLNFEFTGQADGNFDISYVVCDPSENCQIKFLPLDQNQRGKIEIENFDKQYLSFSLILFSKKNLNPPEGEFPNYSFSFKISFKSASSTSLASSTSSFTCSKLERNLKYGMSGKDVRCLQEFLKSQGKEIYPEGLVTGYFGPLTFSAVKRFQQKYWQEILAPWGLTRPTGFVGPTTRTKINQILSSY